MNRNLLFIVLISIAFISCKSPEARRPIQNNSGSFISKSIKRNKALFEKEEKLIIQILETNKTQPYLVSDHGFWYYYNKQDTLPSQQPTYGDQITFNYNIKKLNGTTVLSEDEIGLQNYIVDKTNQDLISGIREGIKLMKRGETVTFLFPSYKAYGYYGIIDKLGINIPIQCTVTLNTINQTNENK